MNSTLSLVKPRKQITHGLKKKKKSKDEILKKEEKKLTYVQKNRNKKHRLAVKNQIHLYYIQEQLLNHHFQHFQPHQFA